MAHWGKESGTQQVAGTPRRKETNEHVKGEGQKPPQSPLPPPSSAENIKYGNKQENTISFFLGWLGLR